MPGYPLLQKYPAVFQLVCRPSTKQGGFYHGKPGFPKNTRKRHTVGTQTASQLGSLTRFLGAAQNEAVPGTLNTGQKCIGTVPLAPKSDNMFEWAKCCTSWDGQSARHLGWAKSRVGHNPSWKATTRKIKSWRRPRIRDCL